MRWLWPYSDFLKLFPWVLKDFLDFLDSLRMIAVFVTQMLVSQLAGVHWPVALLSSGELYLRPCLLLQAGIFSSSCVFCLSMVQYVEAVQCWLTQNVYTCSAGFATVFISGRAKLFWKFGVANTVLLHLIRLCLGHAGALPLPGDKACDLFALSALAGLLCIAVTPQGTMWYSLWSGVRSAVQDLCARFSVRRYCNTSTAAHQQPLHSRSLFHAVSGEVFVTDAATASIPGICITADCSTVPHQAIQYAAAFSDSSQIPRAPLSGRNEATGSSLHDAGHAVMHGTASLTHSASAEAEHPNLVCFWLGKPRQVDRLPKTRITLHVGLVLVYVSPKSLFKAALFTVCPPLHFCILSMVFQT